VDCSPSILESQVDWLTLTHPSYAPGHVFTHWGKSLLHTQESADNHRVPWKRLGYEGERCGKCSWGVGPQGAIIVLSGEAAAERLDTALDLAANISRTDLAVTVNLGKPDPDLERRQFQEFRQWHSERGSAMRGSHIASVDGGATTYVGSRASELFLRVYNKEIESRDPRTRQPDERYINCHRWELEVKGSRCRKLANTISTSVNPSGYIRALLASHLTTHGMDDAYICAPPERLIPGFRRRSDADTKLQWLGTQVRSTCDWLADHGHQAKVLHALGYDEAQCLKVLQMEEVRKSREAPQ